MQLYNIFMLEFKFYLLDFRFAYLFVIKFITQPVDHSKCIEIIQMATIMKFQILFAERIFSMFPCETQLKIKYRLTLVVRCPPIFAGDTSYLAT